MPNKPVTNRPEIVKKIAKDLNITQNQTEKIILGFERQIVRFLREREQVRLHGFGRLVVVTRKSRTIKQVNTGIPRLLLENKTILFRINPNFKDFLHGRPPKLKFAEQKILKTEKKERKDCEVRVANNEEKTPASEIKIQINTMSEERKAQIKESIRQKALGLKGEAPTHIRIEEISEVRVMAALLKQVKQIGYDSISFTLSNKETVEIFAGRPQRQISHLPKNIVKRFLEAVELHDLLIPQERYLPLALNKEKYDKIFLELHSMPTVTGASVKITIK